MSGPDACVIVGASLAGARAAATLREEGYTGRIELVGEEAVLPYERPPLSKTYLQGSTTLEEATVFDTEFYASHEIELRLSTVATAVDVANGEVLLSDGSALAYDRLLLATGAAPRRLGVPGAELPEVLYLRRSEDADAIRAVASTAGRIVVIGAGWIGTEVAASARQLGASVSIVDMAATPLERVLGSEVGQVFADLHREHGVDLRLGTGIAEIRGTDHVEDVVLSDGTAIEATAVVVGVGVLPRTELAEAAGLTIENGVVTDAELRTSAASVYAAGDVANPWHPLYGTHLRLEHWSAALNQGPVAARNMLGASVAYDRTPYFFSDQYEFGMEYRGFAPSSDQVVFRGDRAPKEFIAFWLRDDQVLAAMNANVWDQGEQIERLVRAEGKVDPRQLADVDVPLDDLVPVP